MATKAGQVVINISAGTAQMISDLEKGKTKFKEFGQAGVSGLQASSAALRELEGNFGHNIRAVENFMSKVIGMGPMLKAIFPVVGGLAFAGLLTDLGKKLYDFYAQLRNAPEKVSGAFATLREGTQLTNDELALTNDRLQDQINKLSGKPQNRLKETIDEAVVSADKLGAALAKDSENLFKLLQENNPSAFTNFWQGLRNGFGAGGGLVGGIVSGTATAVGGYEDARRAGRLTGGYTGAGGFTKERRELEEDIRTRLLAAKTDKEVSAIQDDATTRRLALLDKEKKQLSDLDKHTGSAAVHELLGGEAADITSRELGVKEASVQAKRQAELQKIQERLANAKIERPADNAIAALQSQLAADRLKEKAAGGDWLQRAVASGNASADVKITEVRKALQKTHGTLSELQELTIRNLEVSKAISLADGEWAGEQRKLSLALGQRLAMQNRLTAAVGKGYEAEKAAAVENQVAQAMGERYNKAAFAAEQAKQRAGFGAAYEAAHRTQMAETIDKLGDELAMTQAVTAAVTSGAYAIRLATEAERERQELDKTHDPAVVAAMRKQFDADEAKNAAESAEKIRQETTAIKARTDATWQGAMAQRAAELQAKYAQMGATAGPNADAVVAAEKQKDIAQLQGEIATQASRAGMAYQSSMEFLNRELVYLQGQSAATKQTLAYQISLRSVEDERLKLAAAYALEQRTALAGVRSFFLEMQTQAESSAKIIYDALNRALDDTSANLAKMLTGQKASWGEMFRNIGQQMVQSSTKSLMQQGLGKLGQAFGIKLPGMGGKPGDSPGNPMYVSDVNAAGAAGDTINGITGVFNKGGGKSGGSSGGGFGGLISSLLGMFLSKGGSSAAPSGGEAIGTMDTTIAGLAQGGYMSPDKAYMTGEEGIELITKTSGYVTRNSELGRMMGEHSGGSTTYIDARGTDAAQVEARVRRAMSETHNASVGTSVKTAHEQAARRPKK